MSPRWFGTDGIRGVANQTPMTPEWLTRLGFQVGRVLAAHGVEGPVVLGRDTRRSSPWLAAAASAGLASAGFEVLDGDVLPTPAVAYLARKMGAALGVVVTASHNPAEENGIKFFSGAGGKLPPEWEAEVEERMELDPEPERRRIVGPRVGRLRPFPSGRKLYVDHLVGLFQAHLPLTGVRIGFDGAHGATVASTPEVLRALGATVETIHCSPDGMNINEACGANHPEALQKMVVGGRLALGITHDGDGDRIVMVDRTGRLLDGDDMLYVLAAGGSPRPARVVGTVMSNLGLSRGLAELGIELLTAPVGDRNVKEVMDKSGATLGGEPSGHLIIPAYAPSGDGLYVALSVLRAAGIPGQGLEAWAGRWRRYPQVMRNLPAARKPSLETIPGFAALLAEVEAGLAGKGRVVVRYSGTEAKCRVMAEAETEELAAGAVERLAGHLAGPLG